MAKIIYISNATALNNVLLNAIDATNWNSNNSIIYNIQIQTSSVDWNLDIFCSSNQTSGMFDFISIVKNGNGNINLMLNMVYVDFDNNKSVHLLFEDNTGDDNSANIGIFGQSMNILQNSSSSSSSSSSSLSSSSSSSSDMSLVSSSSSSSSNSSSSGAASSNSGGID